MQDSFGANRKITSQDNFFAFFFEFLFFFVASPTNLANFSKIRQVSWRSNKKKKQKKVIFKKKKDQEIILASQFFFLAPKDFHGNFSLTLFLLVRLMKTCIKNFFFLIFLLSCIHFFFLKKTKLKKKKTAKKLSWLANNLSWRFFSFFEKITLKKKRGQVKKKSPTTGDPYPWAPWVSSDLSPQVNSR